MQTRSQLSNVLLSLRPFAVQLPVLPVVPVPETGTCLSAQEFRDGLYLRYGMEPPRLPSRCDGCHGTFSKGHALSCKKGGLVLLRHNDLRDELAALASKALTPSSVREEPRIYPIRSQTSVDEPVVKDARGDVLIRGLFQRATDCILDVKVSDLDAKSYSKRAPAAALRSLERAKKRQYLQPCLEQRRHFVPFVASVDGLLGSEAQEVLRRLSHLLSEKWSRPYSAVRGYLNARLSLAIVRGSSLCLRGSRVPAKGISFRHHPAWDDAAGAFHLQQA